MEKRKENIGHTSDIWFIPLVQTIHETNNKILFWEPGTHVRGGVHAEYTHGPMFKSQHQLFFKFRKIFLHATFIVNHLNLFYILKSKYTFSLTQRERKKKRKETYIDGEMALWLGVLAALAEDPRSVPCTYTTAHKCL